MVDAGNATKITKQGQTRWTMHIEKLMEFWRLFRKNRAAVIGLVILLVIMFLATFARQLMPYSPWELSLAAPRDSPDGIYKPPSRNHLMGTDDLGRDVFSRFIWGSRFALLIGFVAAGVSTCLGLILGSLAGYFGGMADGVIMRTTDVLLTLPTFFAVLIFVALWGRNQILLILIIGTTIWPSTARLVRAEVLSFKHQEFTLAARCAGATSWHIIFREILPNVAFVAIVNSSMQTAFAITIESSLAYLGLGDPLALSWGWQLHYAMQSIRRAWWMATFPGFGITLVVVAFNLIGDGLNDALNPYLKERNPRQD